MASAISRRRGNTAQIAASGTLVEAEHIIDTSLKAGVVVSGGKLRYQDLSFDSIADFQAFAATTASRLVDGQVVTIKGYYSAGDGGGQELYWDSASTDVPNGGTVFRPSSISGSNPGRFKAVIWDGDVRKFGAKCDGLANDTEAITAANAAGKKLVFPSGYTVTLQNWVPLTDTTIIATGATVRRYSTAEFGTTGSSAAVILSNDRIQIIDGTWTDGPGLSRDQWTGAILIDGGSELLLRGLDIYDSWGGIFGHESQNGSNVSKSVSITGCRIRDCSHNLWLADIEGLTFANNISSNSLRDGLRLYRNVTNFTITGNVFRDNGRDDVQSSDCIDIFYAGKRGIISNNIMYGAQMLGLDIKRNQDGVDFGGGVEDSELVITGNIICNNQDFGIQIEVGGGVGNVERVIIANNWIAENGLRGLFLKNVTECTVSGNHVYDNGSDGMRFDDCDNIQIVNNIVKENTGIGIYMSTGSNYLLEGNIVIGDTLQTQGIVLLSTASGRCINNRSSGHSTANINCQGNGVWLGKEIQAPLANATTGQLVGICPNGQLSGIIMLLNDTATMDVALTKRSETAGTNVGILLNTTGTSFPTAAAPVAFDVSGLSHSIRTLANTQGLLLTLANITSTFSHGWIRLTYVD